MSQPASVGTVATTLAQREAARAEARAAFARTFTCPDLSRVNAPCDRGEVNESPIVTMPDGGRVYCPVFATANCEVFKHIERRRAERARREWVKAGQERGIALREIDATMETAQSTAAHQAMARFLEHDASRGRWLILAGTVGTGKTWVASAAVRAWPRSARILSCDKLVADLMDWDERPGAIAEATDVGLLAIDDYGRGYMKPDGFAELGLEEILCARHAELRPTIVTTNWTPEALRKRLSERLVDRIRECGEIVALKGASLR